MRDAYPLSEVSRLGGRDRTRVRGDGFCEWPLARSSNLSGLGLPQGKETAGYENLRHYLDSTPAIDR